MNIDSIASVARSYADKTSAKLGFGFCDLASGASFFLHGDDAFPAASAYKVWILAEVLRGAEAGGYSMQDRLTLTREVKSLGSGVLYDLGEGLQPTLLDYATLMMILSDNTATDVLFGYVGRDNIKQNILDRYELAQTKCDWTCARLIEYTCGLTAENIDQWASLPRYFRNKAEYACTTEENDQTSPQDAVKTLRMAYEGTLVSPTVSAEMLRIMKLCQTNSRIPKHLPRGTEVAHKTGTIDRVANDMGIVYTPKGDYVLTLFYNGNLANEEDYAANLGGGIGDTLLAELSRDVYAAYMA
ncbi:MAG: hypothetical protein ABT01_04220 [Clostridium sp. SCN 57-10]|nr:MAG: hypothetical protein ABT01_04220 [Clostridium sp. SCN 57-10]